MSHGDAGSSQHLLQHYARARGGVGVLSAAFAVWLAVGCVDRSTVPTQAVPGPHVLMQVVPSTRPETGYVSTPAGWYHRSCVYEIPSGSVVRGDTVQEPSGAVSTHPACAYPHFSSGPSGPASVLGQRRHSPPPTDTGWVIFGGMVIDTTVSTWRNITAYWTVPDGPASSYGSSQVYYNFPGLQNLAGILQPVLTFGYNGDNHWQVGVWYCTSSCPHSSLLNVNQGDSLYGYADGYSCSGGSCSWTVYVEDVTALAYRSETWTGPDNAWLAVGGAVETAALSNNCALYPTKPVKFHNISLSNRAGTVSQSWATDSGPVSGCARAEINGSTSVAILENIVAGFIDGPTSVNSGMTCTYTAFPSGGWGGPYSFSWSVDGTILSGQGTNQITASFTDGNHQVSVQETDSQGVVGGINITVSSQTSSEFTCAHT
jgi:hypothetical protein